MDGQTAKETDVMTEVTKKEDIKKLARFQCAETRRWKIQKSSGVTETRMRWLNKCLGKFLRENRKK